MSFKNATLGLGIILAIPNFLLFNTSHLREDGMFNEKPVAGYSHVPHKPNPMLQSIQGYSQIVREKAIKQSQGSGYKADDYIDSLKDIVKTNYLHNTLEYRCVNHWLACLLSKSKIPKLGDLLDVLDPNDIARAKHGICSQQAILVQAILDLDNHNYASIRFSSQSGKGHFATAAFIEGKSYFIDTNMDPRYSNESSQLQRFLSNEPNEFFRLYGKWLPNMTHVSASIGDFNRFPAFKGLMFQKTIFFIERNGWLLLLLSYVVLSLKYKNNPK